MFSAQALTDFETRLLARIEALPSKTVFKDRTVPSAEGARAFTLKGDGALLNCTARNFKYGLGISAIANDVLIKNFDAQVRLSPNSIYGSGIIGDGPNTHYPASNAGVYVSNVFVDQGLQPDPTYKRANVDGLTIEQSYKTWRIRECALLNSGDAGIDGKSPYEMDACVVTGGHRVLRFWGSGTIRIANSILIARKGYRSFFWGGGGDIRFEYHNCLFGYEGDQNFSDTFPSDGLEQEEARVTVAKLSADPFDRSSTSFWQPGRLYRGAWPDIGIGGPASPPPPPPPPVTETSREAEIGKLVLKFLDLIQPI